MRLVLALFLLTFTSFGMSDASELVPDAVPTGEAVLSDESHFVDACKSAIAEDARKFGWSFGSSLLTRSEQWGLVWRVDFFVPGHATDSPFVNRAICWGEPNGTVNGKAIVFGKRMAPLG